MKVLFVSHYTGFGGANQSCIHLMRLLKIRHNVDAILLVPKRGEIQQYAQAYGVRCDVLRYASWRGPRRGVKGFVYAILVACVNVIAVLSALWRYRNEAIDIVHSNSSLVVFGWMFAKLTKKPVVWHLREYDGYEPIYYYYGEWLSGRIYGSADRVIAISHDLAAFYARFIVPKEKIQVVYNGIDFQYSEKQASAESSLNVDMTGFRIVFVGGINKLKNPYVIIRALSLIKTRGKLANIHLYILGQGTEECTRGFVDLVTENGLQDRVHMLGFQKNIWPIISKMDLGITPSMREAFGRTVVECMMCKIPVLASRVDALKEIVTDGETGLLFNIEDDNDLADKILKLYDNPKLRNQFGSAGYDRAISLFTAQSNADRICSIYDEVLRG